MRTPSASPLRLLMQFFRAQAAGDPHGFRFEPQEYILPTEGGSSPSARLEWTAELLADLAAVRVPGCDPAIVQRVGETLRRFVKDAGWAQIEAQIKEANEQRRPIFLTIRSSAAELYALPWELLKISTGQSIATLDRLLLRFEWPDSRSVLEAPRLDGGRILFAWSAAGGAVPAREHLSAIAAACEAGFLPFHPESDVIPHVSLTQIVDRLEQAEQSGAPIAVLHLLCHGCAVGSTFGLALNGGEGQVSVDASQLQQHLAPFARTLRLIVLAACDSGNPGALGNQLGSVAQALHRCGFAAVVASRFPLSVIGSQRFAETFYSALLSRPDSVEAAFLAGRKCLLRSEVEQARENQLLDYASLQLYARHEDGDDTRPVAVRPYRGLLAFEPEHRRFFFGRDAELKEICADLQTLVTQKKARFLVVAGASGTGKSSVVYAGAAPRILEADSSLKLLRMRPGSDPLQALDAALALRPADRPALLIVDQFEEIFTHTESPAPREAFVKRLWALACAEAPDIRILITLRVDFIGRCGELAVDDAGLRLDRVAYDEAHRIFVAQLHLEQLRAAIVEPARKVGLELESGLVERMLDEIGSEPGALPMLEHALDELWKKRDGRRLTQAAYDEVGGVIGALQQRADQTVAKLGADELSIVQRLLVSLVAVADETALDTRLRVSLAELRQGFSPAEMVGFEKVLKALSAERLLVQNDDEKTPQVEVAHEALIRKWPRLRTWLDEDRASLVLQRRIKQAAQQWQLSQRDKSLLYRGGQLVQALDWRHAKSSRPGAAEIDFLDASEQYRVELEQLESERQRKEREAEAKLAAEKLESQRRLSRFALRGFALMVLLFVASLIAGAYANGKSREARDGMLVAVAQSHRSDPTLAATILREAGHRKATLWMQTAMEVVQAGIAEPVLRGHEGSVNAVAFSPDGKKLASCASDTTVRIWSADGSGTLAVLRGPAEYSSSLSFSPDGKKIAVPAADYTVHIWNADGTGEPLILRGHTSYVAAVAFSPDGKHVASSGGDFTLQIWNADGTGEPIVHKAGHIINAIAYSPNGQQIASAAADKLVRIWTTDGNAEPVVLRGHEDFVVTVAYAPDGKKLASGGLDKTVRIWNADGTGEPVVLRGIDGELVAVAYSPIGTQLAVAAKNRTIRIWNADGRGEPRVLHTHESSITSIAYSPDGKKLATGAADRLVRIWRADETEEPRVLRGHDLEISAVAYSPDGKTFASASSDKTIRVWSADGSGEPVVLRGHDGVIPAIAYSPDSKKVASGGADKIVRIWNADGSGRPVELQTHQGFVKAVAFSRDGTRLAVSADDRSVTIWNADGTGKPVKLPVQDARILSLAYRPDGRKLAGGMDGMTVRIWNADGSGEPWELWGHGGSITAVAYSPDGKLLATGSADKTVRIWEADGMGQLLVLRGHESLINSLSFSPDSKRLASSAWDKMVRIWNTDGTGEPLVLRDHESGITSVAFSTDGKTLVTGMLDKTVRVWTVESDALLAKLWAATRDCIPAAERRSLLLESSFESMQGEGHCLREIEKRGGVSTSR